VGALVLAGLALSWALQTPIESFTGWLLNSFKTYYRIGDRIEVGDIFGDVYQIDVMTTTVWELGGPDKDVRGAQPTGALVTFPNSEVLRSSIINYTRDFTHVWDEVSVGVANESDLAYAMAVVQQAAAEIVGSMMEAPAREYARLLEERRLMFDVATQPTVYVSPTESWTNLIVRYLVPARERRKWATELVLGIGRAFARPEHQGRIIPAYPRTRVELVDRCSDAPDPDAHAS
jgi:small conductance mechanosensitive channel